MIAGHDWNIFWNKLLWNLLFIRRKKRFWLAQRKMSLGLFYFFEGYMGGSRTNAEKSAQKHGVRLNIFPVVFRALQAFFKFYKPKLLRTIWFALGKINVLEETISNINSIFTNVKDVTNFVLYNFVSAGNRFNLY